MKLHRHAFHWHHNMLFLSCSGFQLPARLPKWLQRRLAIKQVSRGRGGHFPGGEQKRSDVKAARTAETDAA